MYGTCWVVLYYLWAAGGGRREARTREIAREQEVVALLVLRMEFVPDHAFLDAPTLCCRCFTQHDNTTGALYAFTRARESTFV